MATTDLKLEDCGSLPKPGPVGRLMRLAFGMLCLAFVNGLLDLEGDLLSENGRVKSLLWNGIILCLFLVSYVVNIGYSLNWKKRPAIVSATLLAVVGGIGYLQAGTFDTILLARTLFIWEFYVMAHLGLSFVLAALIRTPGCEMRAIPHLISLITGGESKEHVCPVGPLGPVDDWEAKRGS